jgi:hypothetical protein
MQHRKVQGMMPSQKLNEIRIQQELERRILHGLACEWKEALWVLDSPHEELMRKPMFSLGDMKSKLGEWPKSTA